MKCILCGSTDLRLTFLLEDGPRYAQKLLDSPDPVQGRRVDISLYKCADCDMVQIDPDTLEHDAYFEDYLMSRSCTELYVRYDTGLAEDFVGRFDLEGKRVVEIGCGDGFFAEQLKLRGVEVCAVEPSATARGLAEQRGVECYDVFLGPDIDTHVTERFDAFVTKQVMDLVKDPNTFLASLGRILRPGAHGLVDVPSWTKTLLDRRYYDVLGDRVGYYTARTLSEILERNHFHVLEVFRGADDEYVGAYVCYEGGEDGLTEAFTSEFSEFKSRLSAILEPYRAAGKRVAAWGAGAKGVTLFSFARVDASTIPYVVDKDPHKWGRYLPGSLLRVVPPERVGQDPVDAMIITGVMFSREITRELVRDHGFTGDIILLSPTPRVLGPEETQALLAT